MERFILIDNILEGTLKDKYLSTLIIITVGILYLNYRGIANLLYLSDNVLGRIGITGLDWFNRRSICFNNADKICKISNIIYFKTS